ncbi:Ribosomal RNA small subunit methyltransferase B [Actinomyces bovis]|uniref:Ribosomal RNA small subunit methyltransferase B n=1 Tax=Actinomyces bovis TaxID=1658 RepID=A0ABY1VPV2_9ACTO|nr:transcription antitermination factor NusB [Actinomyces bovis]SPT54035.1 Ribosomal RNA small subunit methyltransferase B [Actinomyces bovis]VEG53809.1 Ribosomal RNA small subunit methyltransferase B [Actinomyces israelii]
MGAPRGGGHAGGAGRGGDGQRPRGHGQSGRHSQVGAQRRGQGRQRGKGNNDGRRNPIRRPAERADARRQPREYQDPARLCAFEALLAVREDGAFANLALPPLLDAYRLDKRDAAFTTALTYGTLRLQGRYDAIIAQCVDRPLKDVDPRVLDLLRLGAHQLLSMRVPSHAAVSATVDLSRHVAGSGAASFVNAILRRLGEHDADAWLERLSEDNPDELTALAARNSHPLWVAKALRQALIDNGRDATELEALLEANNADPEVTLCARPGLVAPEVLAKEAAAATGRRPHLGDSSPYAVVLAGGDPGRIASVRSSRAGVEDEGSQLVALVLSEAPLEGRDKLWLDMCAGPGGKAALLGARAAQRGVHLVASEVAPHRADLVDAAVRALSEAAVEVRCADGRSYGSQEPGCYDRVLVDVPCTGLGSLRRRPESRWRRSPQDVKELTSLQQELLSSALKTVRRGGLVAYVTCSPHLQETRLVVEDVIRALAREGITTERLHAGNVATRVAPRPPAGADRELLQLWPHLDGTDAMFCALLRRTH